MRRVSALLLLLCLRGAAQTPATQAAADSSQAPSAASAPVNPVAQTPIPGAQTPIELPPPPLEQPHGQLSPLLSPQAAYDQATLPLDITRSDSSNWSDTELAALDVAVAEAKDACIARSSETYTGADLVGYAKLCAGGKEWPATYLAATTYINGKWPKPLLGEAYAYEVQADMNMGDAKAAQATCIAMLRSVPYNALTDDVASTTLRYLQFAYLPLALDLAFQRQPYILALLRGSQPVSGSPAAAPEQPAATPQPQAAAATPAVDIPIHTLFEHALELAALQQYNNQPQRAAAALADIDRALPASLPPDEAIYIAADRRQYALLGTRFPALPGAVSLRPATGTPPGKPNLGESTLFLLFPPWCVQCIRQAKDILPSLLRDAMVNGSDARLHIYALLADDPPAQEPPAKPVAHVAHEAHESAAGVAGVRRANQPGKPADQPTVTVTEGKPATAEEQLRTTPTLVVARSTLTDFNAMNFPFLIAVDHDGFIRLMVPGVSKNLLVQGGPAEQISDTILQLWPAPPSR